MPIFSLVIVLLPLMLFTACGSDSQSTGILISEDNNRQTTQVNVLTPASLFIDVDTNELQATIASNNNFNSAQRLSAPSNTLGFVSLGGTGQLNDRFFADGDPIDMYHVTLLKNDGIYLHSFDQPTLADLDLYLFDSHGNILKYSERSGGDEFIRADTTDDYYIMVKAGQSLKSNQPNYSSKYQLSIRPDSVNTALVNTNQPAEFITDEVLVQYQPEPSYGRSLATTQKLLKKQQQWHKQSLNNQQDFSPLSAFSTTQQHTSFEATLKQINHSSYEKWQTLKRIKTLKRNTDVAHAEPNYLMTTYHTFNDPLASLQWYFSPVNYTQGLSLISQVPQNDVIVAVIDSGIYLDHEDLRGRLLPGFDFISNTANACDGDGIDPNPNDPGDGLLLGKGTYHGTHVAGIIAANTNNAIGIAGMSATAKIMPLRVIGCRDGTNYDVIQALKYAAGIPNDSGTLPAQTADVINLSLGTYSYSQATQDVINQITRQGIIVIAAAGNDADSSPAYPASYNRVFSVSATNSLNQPAYYSNYGNAIDFAAPGGDSRFDHDSNGYTDGIISLVADRNNSNQQQSQYRFYQGSSMATPIVSAIITQMKSINPQLTTDDIQSLLMQGELTNGTIGSHNLYTGYGIIDAEKALYTSLDRDTAASMLFTDVKQLYLNRYQTNTRLTIKQSQGAPITLSSIRSDAAWLTITPININAQGLGHYDVSTDIQQLPLGEHESLITLTGDNNQVITISALATHRKITSSLSDTGVIWLLLVDPETYDVRHEVAAKPNQGHYTFTLNDIPESEYLIIAGSDIDNDQSLCHEGEICAAYPSLSEIQPVRFNGKQQQLHLSLDIVRSAKMTSAIHFTPNRRGNHFGNSK